MHPGPGFSGERLRIYPSGGTISSVILLAEAFAKRGHSVIVFNGVATPSVEYGVNYLPLAEARKHARGEIGIAVANPRVFEGLAFHSSIYWVHNPLRSWAQVRRGTLWPLLRMRPHFVLLGDYHSANVPGWLPSKGRTIIHHGIQENFFRNAPAQAAPPPRATFTSAAYRGLDWLLGLWGEIGRLVPEAVFDIFATKERESGLDGVRFHSKVSRRELLQELGTSRVQFVPGHRDETYCLAAAEATAAGVPIVTLGIGSLSERVRDGETGFIVHDREGFIERAAALLSDDELWLAMHRTCLAEAAITTWSARAEEWERLFLKLSR